MKTEASSASELYDQYVIDFDIDFKSHKKSLPSTVAYSKTYLYIE